MSKYIHSSTAAKDRNYQAVLHECSKLLESQGYFRKESVMKTVKLELFTDAINWNFIIDWLQDENGHHKYMVVPVADRFFKGEGFRGLTQKNDKGELIEEHIAIGQFIASGNGKKTAGYVRVSFQGGKFLLWRASKMVHEGNGKAKALKRFVERASQDPKLPIETRAMLPSSLSAES